MAGSKMNSAESSKREQVSALADGELDVGQAKQLLRQMHDDEARATWALYHRIGDVIRSEEMAAPVSEDFSRRFAARFASEPPLLAPKRRLLSRFGAWPTTLAAVAATAFGFFVAPTLFGSKDAPVPAAPTVASRAPVSHGALLADAKAVAAADDTQADYIRMHHASYSPLYDAPPVVRTRSSDSETTH